MPTPRSRRQVLRSLSVGGALGLAGCLGGSESPDSVSTTDSTTTTPPTTATTTDAEPTTETDDTDERVTRTPPGSPALSPSGEWPTYRFDARNAGYNPDGAGVRDVEPYWRLRPVGTPSVSDDALFAVSGYDRNSRAFTRRNPATAGVRSETDLVQYGVNSPPTVADGRAFVTTFIEVFCLATDRDEVLWRGPEMDGVQGAPTVSDGTVFVNSGGFQSVSSHLRAFDAETGAERWRYDTGSETKSTPAVADGRVFVNSAEGLHAVDTGSGERLYTVPETGNEWGTPAISEGTVYVVATRREDNELFAIDAADGSVRWRHRSSELGSDPPVLADGLVYVPDADGVVALDSSAGTPVTTLGGRGEPVARVGSVVYAVENGELYALDAEGEGVLWSYRTEEVQIQDTIGRNVYGVTPVDGAIYVSARDAFHGIGPTT
jgi:outer membrane protein assembly factor BamB